MAVLEYHSLSQEQIMIGVVAAVVVILMVMVDPLLMAAVLVEGEQGHQELAVAVAAQVAHIMEDHLLAVLAAQVKLFFTDKNKRGKNGNF
jgi:hypothetical protein